MRFPSTFSAAHIRAWTHHSIMQWKGFIGNVVNIITVVAVAASFCAGSCNGKGPTDPNEIAEDSVWEKEEISKSGRITITVDGLGEDSPSCPIQTMEVSEVVSNIKILGPSGTAVFEAACPDHGDNCIRQHVHIEQYNGLNGTSYDCKDGPNCGYASKYNSKTYDFDCTGHGDGEYEIIVKTAEGIESTMKFKQKHIQGAGVGCTM